MQVSRPRTLLITYDKITKKATPLNVNVILKAKWILLRWDGGISERGLHINTVQPEKSNHIGKLRSLTQVDKLNGLLFHISVVSR